MPRSRTSIGPFRHPESHEAILVAAEELLQEGGYAGLSLDAVARRANASKPTLYKWWKNKAGLIAELYGRQATQLRPVPDKGSLKAELLFLSRDLWRLWGETSYGEVLRSLIAEAQLVPQAREVLRDELMPVRQAAVRQLFERAIARGEIAAGAPVDAAITLLTGFHWYRLLTDHPPTPRELEDAVGLVARGAGAGETPSPPKPARRGKAAG